MPVAQDVELAQKALQRYLAAVDDDERAKTYPAIWLFLDAAIEGARAEGKDTSRIDAIRAPLGERAKTPPVPPDDAGIVAAQQAFAWFRANYAALEFSAAESIPNLGPSKTKKFIVYGIAGVIMLLCAIGFVISRIGMRGGFR